MFAFFNELVAQSSFNRSVYNKSERAKPVLELINGDYYFMCQSTDATDFENVFLYRYDKDGNLIFRKGGYRIPFKGLKTFDNKLLILAKDGFCDVPPVNIPIYMMKIDTNGTVMFSDTCKAPYAFIQCPDSTFIGFTATSIMYRYSKTGQTISVINTGLPGVSSSLLMTNGNILLSTGQGFYEITPTASVVSSNPAPILTKMVYFGGQKIMGCSAGVFYKFTSGRLLTASITVTPGIVDFVCDNDTICALQNTGSYSGSNTYYQVLDTSFTSIIYDSVSFNKIRQVKIIKKASRVGILSEYAIDPTYPMFTSGNHAYASVLNVSGKLTGNQFKQDLALVSFGVDSSYQDGPILYLRANVTVKNKGNVPVNKFKLNCFSWAHVVCGNYYHNDQYNGKNILPGASLTVKTSFIPRLLSSIYPPNISKYCIYSTGPNDEADKNLYDNEICHSFDIYSLGIAEELANETTVLPNPFGGSLMVKGIEFNKIEIINCLGIVVISLPEKNDHVEINTAGLINGIYFIRIETEKGTVIKKVVKS